VERLLTQARVAIVQGGDQRRIGRFVDAVVQCPRAVHSHVRVRVRQAATYGGKCAGTAQDEMPVGVLRTVRDSEHRDQGSKVTLVHVDRHGRLGSIPRPQASTAIPPPQPSGRQPTRDPAPIADALSGLLSEAGLAIEQQFRDWAGGALTATSPEIFTIAKRA
jgi:hypothetical protein